MAKKQQTKKRRVAAAHQMERQQRAAAKAERRKRLIVGGVVGFLALALIAPLTAGLLANNDPEPAPVTTSTAPIELPWAAGDQAGATLTGPTPCPAIDGSEIRTTEFAEAPPLCIEPGAVYDLTVDTEVGSFTLPLDSTVSEEVANLAAVLGWYRTYEQSPVISLAGGLLWIGSPGNAGFTIDPPPSATPVAERYPAGTVAAIPSTTTGVNGALIVVLDETGSLLLQADPRYVPVGMIDDLTAHQAVYDTTESDTTLVVDSVRVEKVG
ncbi:MAG: hypothetical protein R2707_16385 [Acidimicrobiales bacterium]